MLVLMKCPDKNAPGCTSIFWTSAGITTSVLTNFLGALQHVLAKGSLQNICLDFSFVFEIIA